MSNDLMKRAEELDNLRSKGIAERLTLEEAENIVSVWGAYLEHTGSMRYLLGSNRPESLLPYPIAILQGALNKMEAYYFDLGKHDRVRLLEETEMELTQYVNDEDGIKETVDRLSSKVLQDALIQGLKSYQEIQAGAGFIVKKELWKLSKARIEELLK